MSSAARYSPTPVQLPPSPFHNSVVVLQGPSSPLISTSDQNVRPTINYVNQLADQSAAQTVVQADTASDFVVAGNDEGLDAGVSGELILMQGDNKKDVEGFDNYVCKPKSSKILNKADANTADIVFFLFI